MSEHSVKSPMSSSGGSFQGSSLPLVDLLQVWAANSFSGLVTVTCRGRSGQVYFVAGDIVHAEAGDAVGEAAVQVIVGWPDGSFELFPNMTTLNRTIQKRVSHLLLDAHRKLDELRREAPPMNPPPPLPPKAHGPSAPNVLDQIRALPGFTGLVRFGSDGRPVAGQGSDAEALAAMGLYLAMTHAAAVAQAFGLHDLEVASLQGARQSFILVHSRGNYLCIAVAPGVAVQPLAERVRTLLGKTGPR